MNLGRSINIAMAKKDMNRTALAKALGTSNQAVHAFITRGSAQLETVRKLAEVFGMPVSEFIKLGEE
jgi:DNA-binding XRE family transcriptional regulator